MTNPLISREFPPLRIFRKHAEEQRLKDVGGILALLERSSSAEEYLKSLSCMPALHIHLIELRTRKQSKNNAWFVYRRHAMTASITYAIFHAERKGSTKFRPIALIASCINVPTKIPAMIWGSTNEQVAMDAYQKARQTDDPLHTVRKFGLILDPSFAAWGGSPDGVGTTGSGEKYLIEIKCPFSFSEGSLVENGVERLCYLEPPGVLRKSHAYYFQVQCLMGIMKLKKCMLVIWCPKDMLVIPVEFSNEFYQNVRNKCISYYKNTYLKHIFDNRK